MKAFEDATGITVNYIGSKEFEAAIKIAVDAGERTGYRRFPAARSVRKLRCARQDCHPTSRSLMTGCKAVQPGLAGHVHGEWSDGKPGIDGVMHRFPARAWSGIPRKPGMQPVIKSPRPGMSCSR